MISKKWAKIEKGGLFYIVEMCSAKHIPLPLLLNPHFRKSRLPWYHILRKIWQTGHFINFRIEHYCVDRVIHREFLTPEVVVSNS